MKSDKALRNLRIAIYTPMIFGIVLIGLDFYSRTSDSMPDFNRLLSIMTPAQTVGGFLLFLGINTYAYFVAYCKSLGGKQ